MAIRAHEAQVEVAAPPAVVYRLLSEAAELVRWDVTVDSAEWIDGAVAPAVGARFRVWNVDARFDWSDEEFEIIALEPDRRVGFARIDQDRRAAEWDYALAPAGEGTQVKVAYRLLHEPLLARIRHLFGDPEAGMRRAIDTALHGLREVAEADAARA